MKDTVEIVLAQFNAVVGDLDGNTDRIIKIIKDNRSYGTSKILVFPELALCGYSPEDLLFRKDFAEAVNKSMAKIASYIENDEFCILGAPNYSDNYSNIYNSAYLLNNKDKVLQDNEKKGNLLGIEGILMFIEQRAPQSFIEDNKSILYRYKIELLKLKSEYFTMIAE